MTTTWASVRSFGAFGVDFAQWRSGGVRRLCVTWEHELAADSSKTSETHVRKKARACFYLSGNGPGYSTVTDLARLRGWSTSQPRRTAM